MRINCSHCNKMSLACLHNFRYFCFNPRNSLVFKRLLNISLIIILFLFQIMKITEYKKLSPEEKKQYHAPGIRIQLTRNTDRKNDIIVTNSFEIKYSPRNSILSRYYVFFVLDKIVLGVNK